MQDKKYRMLRQIYEEYYSQIYNYIYYRLLHREETEDLVSQVFLKAAEHMDIYDPAKASYGTWIFRIAKNQLIDYFRTRRDTVSLDDEESGLENRLLVEFEEEYRRIIKPERKAVFAALAQLKERERMILYYVCFLGLSYRETAERMEIGESTLATALMRAKRKLRACMEEGGDSI